METASRVWLLVAVGVATAATAGCRGCKPAGPARSDAGAAPATAWLSGRVVDRRDRPVPEARVLAFPGSSAAASGTASAAGADPRETATDLEGRFRLAGLRSENHRLLIEAAGFPTAEQAAVAAPSDEVTIRLDGEGQSIIGKVVSAAGPVAGARVLLAPDEGGPIRETQTRASGGFAFGGLGVGLYALRATHQGTASAMVRSVPAGDVKGAAAVSLELRQGAGVPGRVIDDAGTGLGEVEVRVESAAGAVGEDPLPTLVRTGASGGFGAGPLLPGSYRLSASRAGSVLRRAPIVEVAPPAVLPPTVLELVRGARVTGRVLDPRGGPAAGARVRCIASSFEDLTVQIGPLPLAAEAAAMPSGAGRALGTTRLAVADRDGRFVVTDLVPGRYRIEVGHPGAEPLRTGEFVFAPAEKRDAGVLSLRAGLPVVGRVMDEAGTAVEGARVVVGEAGAPAETAGLSALTDAEGRFLFALPIGGYRLSATASGPGHGAEVDPGRSRRHPGDRDPFAAGRDAARGSGARQRRASAGPGAAFGLDVRSDERRSCRRQRHRGCRRALHDRKAPGRRRAAGGSTSGLPRFQPGGDGRAVRARHRSVPGRDRGRGAGQGDGRRHSASGRRRGRAGGRHGDRRDPQGFVVPADAPRSGDLAVEHLGGWIQERRTRGRRRTQRYARRALGPRAPD